MAREREDEANRKFMAEEVNDMMTRKEIEARIKELSNAEKSARKARRFALFSRGHFRDQAMCAAARREELERVLRR